MMVQVQLVANKEDITEITLDQLDLFEGFGPSYRENAGDGKGYSSSFTI